MVEMGSLEREELRVVLLNTKNVVLQVVTVYQENIEVILHQWHARWGTSARAR